MKKARPETSKKTEKLTRRGHGLGLTKWNKCRRLSSTKVNNWFSLTQKQDFKKDCNNSMYKGAPELSEFPKIFYFTTASYVNCKSLQ